MSGLFKTSQVFKENLEQFLSVDHLQAIEIYDADLLVGTIENKEGQKGSLALYFYLYKTMGQLDTHSAKRGLELFAEHTLDARNVPGKHPNIDRLVMIEANHTPLTMKMIYKEGAQPMSSWDDEKE